MCQATSSPWIAFAVLASIKSTYVWYFKYGHDYTYIVTPFSQLILAGDIFFHSIFFHSPNQYNGCRLHPKTLITVCYITLLLLSTLLVLTWCKITNIYSAQWLVYNGVMQMLKLEWCYLTLFRHLEPKNSLKTSKRLNIKRVSNKAVPSMIAKKAKSLLQQEIRF